VPWYRRRTAARWAGTLVGLVVVGWLSVFVVFHSARLSVHNPHPTGLSLDIDAHTFMSAFSEVYRPIGAIGGYTWPKESPFIEWTETCPVPIVITSYAISDWEVLHKWITGVDWLRNDAEYDFRVQDKEVFWHQDLTQPIVDTTPLPQLAGGQTQYLTMKRFLELDLEDDVSTGKHRKFEGFVFRTSDHVSLLFLFCITPIPLSHPSTH